MNRSRDVTRIFRIDGEAIRARLRGWAYSLGQSDANVLGIVLFGFYLPAT